MTILRVRIGGSIGFKQVFKTNVVESEVVDALDRGVEPHRRQRARLAAKLEFDLLEMVRIQVQVAKCVDEFSGLEPADLSDHHGQEGVGRDVEGNP